jgi:competence ComEA-like helix-hairpin-helix protein
MKHPKKKHPKNRTAAYTSNVVLAIAGSVLLTTVVVRSEGRADQSQAAQPPATQAANPQAAAPTSPPMSDEELARVGEQLVTKVCATSCHGMEEIDETRRTRAGWIEVVGAMKNKGAQGTDAQFDTIRKYLPRYYGLVAVNAAAPDELSAVMGFSSKDAQAIVAYRTANGPFADIDALRKVPGIDATKIDEQPEALRFK